MFLKITVIVLLNLIIFCSETMTKAQCPRNEVYYNSTISPICDVNCQDLRRCCPLSRNRVVAGCYCRPQYARNLQQICIPRQKCAQDCFANEKPNLNVFRGCESICRTSRNSMRINICYSRQQRRCICRTGYCRRMNACIADPF